MTSIKTYSELIQLPTFEERLEYLRERSAIGDDTFGFKRYLNQVFYRTKEWKAIRRSVILRDGGLDLGIGFVAPEEKLVIHHLKPLTPEDIETKSQYLMNPEFLITTTHMTHNLIHYGKPIKDLPPVVTERTRNDTCPWRLT